MTRKIITYDEDERILSRDISYDKVISVFDRQEIIKLYEQGISSVNILSVFDTQNVIKLYEQGVPGVKGEKGDSEPFYLISPDHYGVSASISFFGQISSSFIPHITDTFDLGSINFGWRGIYANTEIKVQNTLINSGGFGFENLIIERITPNQQTFLIKSGSVSASFNLNGIFLISNFENLPVPNLGGLITSGSEFYIGL